MLGRVVSTKLKNTVTVLVERQSIHPLYKKAFVRSKKYLVDDPIGVMEGDLVEISKIRPISKMKHFRVLKVLGKRMHEITEKRLKEHAKEAVAEVMPEGKKDQLSVLSGQLSDEGSSVVSKSDKQKTEKPKSENRKQKTDNRKIKEDK